MGDNLNLRMNIFELNVGSHEFAPFKAVCILKEGGGVFLSGLIFKNKTRFHNNK